MSGRDAPRGPGNDRWLVDLLDVQPDDRVLEVGFGPGMAIELIATRIHATMGASMNAAIQMWKSMELPSRSAV